MAANWGGFEDTVTSHFESNSSSGVAETAEVIAKAYVDTVNGGMDMIHSNGPQLYHDAVLQSFIEMALGMYEKIEYDEADKKKEEMGIEGDELLTQYIEIIHSKAIFLARGTKIGKSLDKLIKDVDKKTMKVISKFGNGSGMMGDYKSRLDESSTAINQSLDMKLEQNNNDINILTNEYIPSTSEKELENLGLVIDGKLKQTDGKLEILIKAAIGDIMIGLIDGIFKLGVMLTWVGAMMKPQIPPPGSVSPIVNMVLFPGVPLVNLPKPTNDPSDFAKKLSQGFQLHLLTTFGLCISLTPIGPAVVPIPYPWVAIK